MYTILAHGAAAPQNDLHPRAFALKIEIPLRPAGRMVAGAFLAPKQPVGSLSATSMVTTTGGDSLGADLKWLNKPEKFKNTVEHWTHWKYSMVNFLALVNSSYPDVLEQVERSQSTVTIDRG